MRQVRASLRATYLYWEGGGGETPEWEQNRIIKYE